MSNVLETLAPTAMLRDNAPITYPEVLVNVPVDGIFKIFEFVTMLLAPIVSATVGINVTPLVFNVSELLLSRVNVVNAPVETVVEFLNVPEPLMVS